MLLFITVIVGFYMAWNIGANDVSNAMGTSVGSKALTLKKAVFLAAILEFAGAFLLGSHVSSTIQQGIIDPKVFDFDPMIFGLGMMGALLSTGIWLNLASYLRLPVSTTHAIVGSVLGFGAIIGGVHAVKWYQVIYISLSWIIAPLLSGSVSYLIFSFLQRKVLYAFNPFGAAKKVVPFLFFLTFAILVFSTVFKGLEKFHLNLPFILALFVAMLVGFIAAIISIIYMKKMPTFSPIKDENLPRHAFNLEKAVKYLQRTKLSSSGETFKITSESLKPLKTLKRKLKQKTEYSKTSAQYTNVEKVFGYLQIISACLVAFAHGSNDVANAVGPIAAVAQVAKTHLIPNQFLIPSSILLLGAIGIVIGLATWGWRVIETIGHKITELTPTRGFSAEIGSAITILMASKLGLPISTTHALVGSVLGVGLARGIKAINLKVLKDIVLSWIVTMPLCAVLSIIIFFILKAIFHS